MWIVLLVVDDYVDSTRVDDDSDLDVSFTGKVRYTSVDYVSEIDYEKGFLSTPI